MGDQTFGKYQLVKKLATGGMAEVWLAMQTGIEGFNRHVVMKRILPHLAEDPEFVQMFLNEAKIASRFNHPNIAQIYDLGEQNGQYFIAMEYIHGEDIGRIMRRAWNTGQWVAQSVSLRMISDACQGLYYAHSRTDERGQPLRVVHRDISPQNILVSFDGSTKVVDFGIAKAADQNALTKSGAIKGKFAYMAPEQAAGKTLDARSDIFALGLVLYELLTGVRPLKRDSELATLQAALECDIEPPSAVAEVPAELDEVVMRAIAKSPDARYRDARQMQMALEEFLVVQGTVTTSVQVSQLMETLFADRLEEEARLGAPSPISESSASNVAVAPDSTSGARHTAANQDRSPSATIDEDSVSGPSTIMPSRRYAAKDLQPPRQPAAPSRLEVTRAPSDNERRKSSVGLPASSSSTDHTRGDLPPVDDDVKPRRTGMKKRMTASGVPQAPTRRSKADHPAAANWEEPSAKSRLSQYADVAGMKARSASRARLLLGTLVIAGVLGLAALYRDQIVGFVTGLTPRSGGVEVRLTVTSNPKTKVTVVPPRSEKGREAFELGDTPLDNVSGVYVGDTVVLTNIDRGIHYEELIEVGQPDELKLIDKLFKEGSLLVKMKLALKQAEVWRDNVKIGVPSLPISLYEGSYRLEIRAPKLDKPHPFNVRIVAGGYSEVPVDVTESLEHKDPAP